MKYFSRANIYKASNVTFNSETMDAFSYDWWRFVAKIDGKVVFNNYRYSVTTAGHQRKVERLLQNLGIKVDVFLQIPGGIKQGATLAELHILHGKTLQAQAEALEAKRVARNKKARERRLQSKIRPIVVQNIGGN